MVIPKYITLSWTSLKEGKIIFCDPKAVDEGKKNQPETKKLINCYISSSTISEYGYKKDLERRKDELSRQEWSQKYKVAIEPPQSQRTGPFQCPRTIKKWVYDDIKQPLNPDNLAVKFLQEFGYPPSIEENDWFYWVYLCYNELQQFFNYSWIHKFPFLVKRDALLDFQCNIECDSEILQFISMNLMDDPIGCSLLNDREHYQSKYKEGCSDVLSEIEGVYKSFCKQRYWTYLCYFILCRNIIVTDELTRYFSTNGISLAEMADSIVPDNDTQINETKDGANSTQLSTSNLEIETGNKSPGTDTAVKCNITSDLNTSLSEDDTLASVSTVTSDLLINSTAVKDDNNGGHNEELDLLFKNKSAIVFEEDNSSVEDSKTSSSGKDDESSDSTADMGFEKIDASEATGIKESSEDNQLSSSKDSQSTVKEVVPTDQHTQDKKENVEEIDKDSKDIVKESSDSTNDNKDKADVVFDVGASDDKKKAKRSRRSLGKLHPTSVGVIFDYLQNQRKDYSFSHANIDKIELPIDFSVNESVDELTESKNEQSDCTNTKRKLDSEYLVQNRSCSKKGKLSPELTEMDVSNKEKLITLRNNSNLSELLRCKILKEEIFREENNQMPGMTISKSIVRLTFNSFSKVIVTAVSLLIPHSLRRLCRYVYNNTFMVTLFTKIGSVLGLSSTPDENKLGYCLNSYPIKMKNSHSKKLKLENSLHNFFGPFVTCSQKGVLPAMSDNSVTYQITENEHQRQKYREIYKILIPSDNNDISLEINHQNFPWLYSPDYKPEDNPSDSSNTVHESQNTRSAILDDLCESVVVFDKDGNPVQLQNNSQELEDDAQNPAAHDNSDELVSRPQNYSEEDCTEHYSSYFEVITESQWKSVKHKYTTIDLGHERYLTDDFPVDFPEELVKYWAQRYRLFLLFDKGIELDNESWFSVTPEMVAAHHASRCQGGVVVDAFCGAGGDSIQLAMTCDKVIAIDIDPKKIALAKHNARIYGVEDKIEFIVGDFLKIASDIKDEVNAVYLSPPWGGINYTRDEKFDILNLDGNINCKKLMAVARELSSNISLFLPKNSNIYQLFDLVEEGGGLDIELNYFGPKLKSITVYFGDLVHFSNC